MGGPFLPGSAERADRTGCPAHARPRATVGGGRTPLGSAPRGSLHSPSTRRAHCVCRCCDSPRPMYYIPLLVELRPQRHDPGRSEHGGTALPATGCVGSTPRRGHRFLCQATPRLRAWVPIDETPTRTPQVSSGVRALTSRSTGPVKIPAHARLAAHFTPASAGGSNGTAEPRNWASRGKVLRSDATDTTAAQSSWLVSLQPLHTPLLDIRAGQRANESGQHDGGTPTSYRIPRGRRSRQQALPHLCRSQACDLRSERPAHSPYLNTPIGYTTRPLTRRFRRSGALSARGGR